MSGKRSFSEQFRRDVIFVVVAAGISVPVGLTVNMLRADPLPLLPLPPEDRLVKGLAVVSSPAAEVTKIGLDEAIQASDDEATIFVDSRHGDFYQLGRIRGALSLPRGTFREDYPAFVARVSPVQKVIVYCAEADCTDSLIVARTLARLGFSNVAVFEGGWREWEAADLPREP